MYIFLQLFSRLITKPCLHDYSNFIGEESKAKKMPHFALAAMNGSESKGEGVLYIGVQQNVVLLSPEHCWN